MNPTPHDLYAPAVTVDAAIRTRRSIRAFLPKPVPDAAIRDMLALAGRAPSGSNIQPWQVHVLTGATLARIKERLTRAFLDGEAHQRDYRYYTDVIVEPYLGRRRLCGWGLYGTLGIGKGERDKTRAQQARNWQFFDAPMGLVFAIDRALEKGSWLDYGMFLQTLMLSARGHGLHTCAQASIAQYPNLVRAELGLSSELLVICGMAVGYADPDAVVNTFQPARIPVEEYTRFHD